MKKCSLFNTLMLFLSAFFFSKYLESCINKECSFVYNVREIVQIYMSEASKKSQVRLEEVFSQINMSELPAMSAHVQELLALTSGKRSVNYDDLARLILQDYSLTHKVLQFANSAYFAVGQKVSTVSMAVAVLGFDTVRDLAMAIALYDDFIQAGIDTDEISLLLTRSFLAAVLARKLTESRYLKVLPEEAFICGLLRNLGKIIACIYLPGVYQAIDTEVKKGVAEDEAARAVLDGLTYAELGREVGVFWNMTESVIQCMEPDPELPEEDHEVDKYLHAVVDFSNRFVGNLCRLEDIECLIDKYGFLFSIEEEEVVEMLDAAVPAYETVFNSFRPGMPQPDFRKKYEELESRREALAGFDGGREPAEPKPAKKNIEDYWQELQKMVESPFRLHDFFDILLSALEKGIGCDRVILAMLQVRNEQKNIVGFLGAGNVTPQQVQAFRFPFDKSALSLFESLTMGKDMVLLGKNVQEFPDNLHYLVAGRRVYLFPVCLKKKGIALFYLDMSKEKSKLDKVQIEYVKKMRDFSEKVIQDKRKKT